MLKNISSVNNALMNVSVKLICVIIGATSIEKYCLRTNSWTQVGNMSGRRLQFGVAVLEDKLYVVGGRDGLKTLNTVECYDPKRKAWTMMPPMATHRHGLGIQLLMYPFIDVHVLSSVSCS